MASIGDQPVLVTGATGYVAGALVEKLLDKGLTVHAAVRDPAAADKLKYLDAIAAEAPGEIRYFRSDLLEEGSYAEAMQGCSHVFHTASPFTLKVDDPQSELVEPAVLGTRNILETANATDSVQRVVVTSSMAAIHGDNADIRKTANGKFTEDDWNSSASLEHMPYSYSKTLAEREAWKIAGEQDRWRLVVVNSSFVIGPGISPFATSETHAIFRKLADGTARTGVPDLYFNVVDVRDLADAHIAAANKPDAQGRYITSAHESSLFELATILRRQFGNRYPFPRWTLPKPVIWLVGPLFDPNLTRRYVSNNVGVPIAADNRKSINELGIDYRPLEESVVGLFQQLVDNKLV